MVDTTSYNSVPYENFVRVNACADLPQLYTRLHNRALATVHKSTWVTGHDIVYISNLSGPLLPESTVMKAENCSNIFYG